MFWNFILYGMLFLVALVALIMIRVAAGPTVADRMVAIDIAGILIVGIMAIAVLLFKPFIIDLVLVWILLSFIGALSLAKYLEGKNYGD